MPEETVARIIFDEPAADDAFDGKGHERSAKGLADSIVQLANRAKDGAIGLEGSWGSGKSTVVTLTEKMLKEIDNDHQYYFFVFDVWAHQTNDFRQAFLEGFLAWIDSQGQTLLNRSQAKSAKRKVSGKTKRVETENRRQYTLPAAIFLMGLPFVPLALNWTTPVAFDAGHLSTIFGYSIQKILLYGYLGTVILVLGLSLRRHLSKWVYDTVQQAYSDAVSFLTSKPRQISADHPGYPSFMEALSSAVSIFKQEVKKETITQSIRDEDPTNSEFHKVFRDILQIAQQKKRRVVFVLDNIDRLGVDDVRKAWSEIRAVFVNGNSKRGRDEDSSPSVIAVVPYDRAHVLGRVDLKLNNPPDAGATAADNHSIDTEEDFSPFGSGDILSKTFNRIVKVAPPVPSDWHAYMDRLIEVSFVDQFNKRERYKIYKLLDIHLQLRREMVTPRRIVAYINEIGAFWTQWKGVIPAPTIALYVLLRGQIEDRPDVLKDPESRSWLRYLRALNEPLWRQHFVALAYNVLPARANQVLLGQDIARELAAEAPNALIELAKHQGFCETFTDLLDESISEHATDAGELSKVALNIAAIETLPEAESGETWRILGLALEHVPAGKLAPDAIKGLFTVVSKQAASELISSADRLRAYLEKCASPADDKVPAQARLQLGADWVSSMRLLISEIGNKRGNDAADAYWAASSMPSDPGVCIGAAAECERSGGLPFAKLSKSKAWPQGIFDRLGDAASQTPAILPLALPQLQTGLSAANANSLVSKIGGILSEAEQDGTTTESLVAALSFLYGNFRSNAQLRTTLQNLQADGTLPWHFHHAVEAKMEVVAGQLFWLNVGVAGSNALPPIPDHPTLGAMAPIHAWYEQTRTALQLPDGVLAASAECVTVHNDVAAWMALAIADTSDAGPFRKVFAKVIDRDQYRVFDLKALAGSYDRVSKILGADLLVKCMTRLGRIVSNVDELFGESRIDSAPDQLLRDVAQLNQAGALARLLAFADDRLKSVSEESWKSEFRTSGRMVGMLLARLEASGDIQLNANLYNPAVRDCALDCIAGSFTPALPAERWNLLLQAIRPQSLGKTATEVLNGLNNINASAGGAERFVLCYRSIAERLPLPDRPEPALGLIGVLLNSRSGEVSEFLEGRANDIAAAYSRANDTAKGGLEAALSSEEESEDREIAERAARLRELYGLPQRRAAEPEAEGEEPSGPEDPAL